MTQMSSKFTPKFCHLQGRKGCQILWFKVKGTKMAEGNDIPDVTPCAPLAEPVCQEALVSCAVWSSYCFQVLLCCCQRLLNLLIAFHQSDPEPQNACSSLPRRLASDSVIFFIFCRMCYSQSARIQIQFTSVLRESDCRINERMDLPYWLQDS